MDKKISFKEYWQGLAWGEKGRFAKQLGREYSHIWNIANGRKFAGRKLALDIAALTGHKVSAAALRGVGEE